ncbi:hemolysin [Psychrobacter sp. FDAARGOS_221]|uniref:hemolysin n=1 Tax=Psychrobacter sp. FDAARGOS_221 TaxID=1975705 RepID=UPI000C9F2ED9|nr:hemolysin [Psychrobacter sp. FDAARGOS_221]PNK61709.1 hemolysin [Psychrobacter sp. FDAARGOS_221]
MATSQQNTTNIADSIRDHLNKAKYTLQQGGTKAGQYLLNGAYQAGGYIRNGAIQTGQALKSGTQQIILYIPKDYDINTGNGLKEIIDSANQLGIEVQREGKDGVAIAKNSVATAESILGFSQRGLVIFAPQLENLLKKNSHVYNTIGSVAGTINQINRFNTFLSGVKSILGTVSAGQGLNTLISKGGAQEDLARAGLDVTNSIINNLANGVKTFDTFSEEIGKIGGQLQNIKGLGGLGNKLQNPNLNVLKHASNGLDVISGLLSSASIAIILADKNASTDTKVAAGFEFTTQALGTVTKAISSYMIAQRAAAGLTATGPIAAFIGSTVAMAISPLAFLNVADKFKQANMLDEFAKNFKKFGYEGDSLLADFQRETGTIDASVTTINTAISAISAGVGAASSATLVGAPIALLVTGVASLVTTILEYTKQPMFEHVADKVHSKILEWEAKNGKNYFENGYDARHLANLESNMEFFLGLNKVLEAERVVAITQQHWDRNIGDLAGISRLGAHVKSGKSYVDAFEEGKHLQADKSVVLDATNGVIDVSQTKRKTQSILFTTPLLTAGTETRERIKTGKHSYITKIHVNRVNQWTVTDGDASSTFDFTNVLQRVGITLDEAGNVLESKETTIIANLGKGDDNVFVGSGRLEVDGGEGYDKVHYSRGNYGALWIDATNETTAGSYEVKRWVGEGRAAHEVIGNHLVRAGSREELIQFRHGNNKQHSGYYTNDKLTSIEEIIGSEYNDMFYGSKFGDVFHGGKGVDRIDGHAGNDYLFGGADDDYINGGEGNDFLDGGTGDDVISGGKGDDIFVYRTGDGVDSISDNGGNDKLSLADINLKEITFERVEGSNLIIKHNDKKIITVSQWFLEDDNAKNYVNYQKTDDLKIEEIIGKNGERITAQQIDDLLKNKSTISKDEIGKVVDEYVEKQAKALSEFKTIKEGDSFDNLLIEKTSVGLTDIGTLSSLDKMISSTSSFASNSDNRLISDMQVSSMNPNQMIQFTSVAA